jgi:hypothetical protein
MILASWYSQPVFNRTCFSPKCSKTYRSASNKYSTAKMKGNNSEMRLQKDRDFCLACLCLPCLSQSPHSQESGCHVWVALWRDLGGKDWCLSHSQQGPEACPWPHEWAQKWLLWARDIHMGAALASVEPWDDCGSQAPLLQPCERAWSPFPPRSWATPVFLPHCKSEV